MGGLSMNPDYDGEERPKLAMQIAEKEDWKETQSGYSHADPEDPQTKTPKKMKIGPLEFDSTYVTSLPGIMRIVQVISMFVAFVFVLIPPEWPDQGVYSFFCVFLILGVLLSSYLLVTLIGGFRAPAFCGFSWFLVELVYFISFGLLIFLGSCLAANKSTTALLTLSAILGFVATVTFFYSAWIVWKLRKEFLRKKQEEEEEDNEDKEEGNDDNSTTANDLVQKNEFEIEQETKPQRKSYDRKNNSLPANLKEQLYQNQMEFDENAKTRKRYSFSDKDSAYSEGTITPTKGKYPHHRMRRSASAHDMDREFDQRQPFNHLNHRGIGGRSSHGKSIKDRSGNVYPRELSANNLNEAGYKYEEDDLNRQKSMPDWLRAALGTEVEPTDHVVDDESEVAMPRALQISRLPGVSPKEFPLLAHSDEESINYPSVSQNYPGRQFQTMPFGKRRGNGNDAEFGRHRYHKNHHGKRRKGHHHHHHSRRPHHHHHHHHQHQRRIHNHKRPMHYREEGRRPINDAHEDYLKRMVGNDELVANDRPGAKSLPGYHSHQQKDSTKKRYFPKRTTSIQFPEESRWDDDNKVQAIQHQMMEKYLQDTENMRR